MTDFIRIVTPNGEMWSDQEHLVRRADIRAIRLVKKLPASGSPDNGIELLLAPETYASWTQHYWIRCPDFDSARALYEEIAGKLDAPGCS